MKRRELREWMERLADHYQLRWAEKSKCFLGIYEGILVRVSEWEGVVTLQLGSPTADCGEEISEAFAGFTHCDEGGLPTSYIQALMSADSEGTKRASRQFCAVELDGSRLEKLGSERFLLIPQLVAEDLHAHGAEGSLPCATCGQDGASVLALISYVSAPLCESCWQEVQFSTSAGRLQTEQSVRWLVVLPALCVLTAVGGYAWGYLQQPERLSRLNIVGLMLPVAWAFGLCLVITFLSGGVTRALRVALCVSVVISVLVGNVWGFRSFAIKQVAEKLGRQVEGPSWPDSIRLYFKMLPDIWTSEVYFFLGGLLGAWIGLRMLKNQGTIQVQ